MAIETGSQQNKNVLLAEDDPDDVLLFTLAVKKIAVRVELRTAKDGDELFVLLKQLIPDIIFLDINMPCKNGLTCITEIRRDRAYDQIPVVMFTSFNTPQYVDQTFASGANFYLVKTDTLQDLIKKLETIFAVEWDNMTYYPPRSRYLL